MMKCEMTDREHRIDDFLQEKMPAAEAEAFERHIFGCAECLAEVRLREQMIKLIKEERVTATDELVSTRRGQRPDFLGTIADFFRVRPNAWIYAGVAAALLVAILVAPLFRSQDAAENYAANFTASPQLESLIGQKQRSSDFSVSAISPRAGENFTGEILFRWQIKKGEDEVDVPLELKILNNQEALMHSARVDGKEYRLRERLAPGLYYWTLEHEGETLYLGKFFVRKSGY